MDGLASGEGLIWAVATPSRSWSRRRSKTSPSRSSSTPASPTSASSWAEGEFARVLQVMSRAENTLSAVLRNAWDRGDLRTSTKNSPAKASGAHISIVGHITGDELVAKLTLQRGRQRLRQQILVRLRESAPSACPTAVAPMRRTLSHFSRLSTRRVSSRPQSGHSWRDPLGSRRRHPLGRGLRRSLGRQAGTGRRPHRPRRGAGPSPRADLRPRGLLGGDPPRAPRSRS